MLQQTQVERVIPKYLAFIERFPSTELLAQASLKEVLVLWQGLGYNRRAKYLFECAKTIEEKYGGTFPQDETTLKELPGIGPYTASAICAFAYNQPVVLIETNVRTVFLYHFFPNETAVSDKLILEMVTTTLDTNNPREWYWVLMDYGSYLKKILPNPSRRSKNYSKQSKFTGSLRQVRGEIIRLLTKYDTMSTDELFKKIQSNKLHFSDALEQLHQEKLVVRDSGKISLAE
jgi:A/G-specific adenine glycosylase